MIQVTEPAWTRLEEALWEMYAQACMDCDTKPTLKVIRAWMESITEVEVVGS